MSIRERPRVPAPGPAGRASPGGARLLLATFAGLLAGAVALGVAELAAAVFGRTSSPVVAVGGAFVDVTPRWLEAFAIRTFGVNDKAVLLAGITATVAVLAAAAGAVAARRPTVGLLGVVALGAVAAAAALSRPSSTPADAVPSLVATATGLVTLRFLLRSMGRPGAAPLGSTEGRAAGRTEDLTDDATEGLDRRRFLVSSLGAGTLAVGGGVAGRRLRKRLDVSASRAAVQLPAAASPAARPPAGARLDVPGISPLYTSNRDFYRVDTALLVPQVAADEWRLRVHGMVRREIELDYDQLLSRPLVERDITLNCVSNEVGGALIGNARWLGAPLLDLLAEAGVRPGADQLVSRSVDGMTIGTPTSVVTDGRDAMLAVAMNGEPLPTAHGFPVRMIVPGLYGYVSATKWVVDIELTTFGAFDAYWVRRGWAQQATVKTSARIDTPRPRSAARAGRLVVAGVAWAQHRGIDRVEVRVDGGTWHQATLAVPLGTDAWRQWMWEWDAREAGAHTLQVRATDGAGQTQTARRVAPFPDGASGWHSVHVHVDG